MKISEINESVTSELSKKVGCRSTFFALCAWAAVIGYIVEHPREREISLSNPHAETGDVPDIYKNPYQLIYSKPTIPVGAKTNQGSSPQDNDPNPSPADESWHQ